MGIDALTHTDSGERIAPQTKDDWTDWVSATATRNYVLDDPLLDWLGLYGKEHGFKSDFQLAGYDSRTDFSRFVMRKGREFEAAVVKHLETLLPIYNAAGRLIERLPELWAAASMEERRRLLLTMMDAVYVDARDEKRIVAIKPKAPFKPILQVATTREGSGVVLVHEGVGESGIADGSPPHEYATESHMYSWWRRGRVELYREHGSEVLIAA